MSTGLRFRAVDLHVHTPASKCFRGQVTPAEYVDQALSGDGVCRHARSRRNCARSGCGVPAAARSISRRGKVGWKSNVVRYRRR